MFLHGNYFPVDGATLMTDLFAGPMDRKSAAPSSTYLDPLRNSTMDLSLDYAYASMIEMRTTLLTHILGSRPISSDVGR